jgi:ribosomal protein L17
MMHPFEYIKPTQGEIERITTLREKCKELHDLILEIITPSRERSLAITKLEEVSMWANKAVVFN